MSYKEKLDLQRIPQHIAIIMDGNGRWAQAKGLSRSMGHQQGVETVYNITEAASNLGVKYLTLYAFSTENWNRPQSEVDALMTLILTHLKENLYMKNNVRLRLIGDIERLPDYVQKTINDCVEHTAKNTGLTQVIALSYSSRWELTKAMKDMAEEVKSGALNPESIDEKTVTEHLNTRFMPDPDLLIRTGGELRISNYLLWQCAYSELYFTPEYWPDFNAESLYKAIYDYQQRERRFGKTGAKVRTEQAG